MFGVLIIHASDRQWLWNDLLNNAGAFQEPLVRFVIHFVLSFLGALFVCVLIDRIRIILIIKPFFFIPK